jgi:hypothetical protein
VTKKMPAAAVRLRRSAAAYQRLAWHPQTSSRQADIYLAKAEALRRQAYRIIDRQEGR